MRRAGCWRMRRPYFIACIALAACHHNTYPDCSLKPANGAAIAWERAPGSAIEGRVVDIDGSPIQSAYVSLAGTQQGRRTDGEGRFRIPAVRPGTYDVEVRLIGYERPARRITLDAGSGAVLTAVLERRVTRLSDECGFDMGGARPWWRFW